MKLLEKTKNKIVKRLLAESKKLKTMQTRLGIKLTEDEELNSPLITKAIKHSTGEYGSIPNGASFKVDVIKSVSKTSMNSESKYQSSDLTPISSNEN
jgi:hypothetical protein